MMTRQAFLAETILLVMLPLDDGYFHWDDFPQKPFFITPVF